MSDTDKTLKEIIQETGPQSVRTPDVTTSNYSIRDLIAWQQYCARKAVSANPKSAIRKIRMRRGRLRSRCGTRTY